MDVQVWNWVGHSKVDRESVLLLILFCQYSAQCRYRGSVKQPRLHHPARDGRSWLDLFRPGAHVDRSRACAPYSALMYQAHCLRVLRNTQVRRKNHEAVLSVTDFHPRSYRPRGKIITEPIAQGLFNRGVSFIAFNNVS